MRRLVPSIMVAVVAAVALVAPPAGAAGPDSPRSVTRYAGHDRYDTAAQLAVARYSSSSDVLLARGDDPTDGLAAAYPAGAHSAPVLLAEHDRVPPVVLQAMTKMTVRTVHLMGGEAALSSGLEQSLRDAGYQVDRYAGADRYETAAIAAQANGIANAGRPNLPERTAMLAAGDRPTDALVTGPLAWAQWPLLLTRQDAVPQVTMDVLDRYDIRHIVLVGGTDAIASSVEQQLRAAGRSIERVAGPTREATATAFADLMIDAGFPGDRVGIASSSATADALALGTHLAPSGPILLCRTIDDCGDATRSWLAARGSSITTLVVAGTTDVVSDQAVAALR